MVNFEVAKKNLKKGFTLLELLIVIGILAILATVTVLVLNPAELLRHASDSQRVSDLATLHGALALFLTTVSSAQLDLDFVSNRCLGNGGVVTCFVDNTIVNGTCNGAFSTPTAEQGLITKGISGNDGWLPVNFNAIPGGSPIPALPRDPTSDATRFYGYMCDVTGGVLNYELVTTLESVKYRDTDDLDGKDGGPIGTILFYEIGTDPGLNL